MKLRIFHFPRIIIAGIAALVLLYACGTTAPGPDVDIPAEQLAERAYAKGDYRTAAEYWQQAGMAASGSSINVLQLKTADAWLRSQNVSRAAELLSQIDQESLTQAELALFNIANADLALQQNKPDLSGIYLQSAAENLPSALRGRFNELQQRLFNMQRGPADRSLLEIAELSEGMTTYDHELALEIIHSLDSVSSGQLTMLIEEQQYDPEFTEWLELALQIRSLAISNSSTRSAAQTWTNYHYGNSVDQANFQNLVVSYRALFTAPSKVAVLLPTDGSLSSAANAIRDGMLSAYLEQPGDTELRFYSSGENGESATAAYYQARDDGATQVVGPLRIESTRALANLDDLTTPVLLLNELPTITTARAGPSGLANSLLLSQAEEATAIANKALEQGYRQVVVIVPVSAWGARVETAFTTAFELGEGSVTAVLRFNSADDDLGARLTQLLKIDESAQRKTALQVQLGIPLNFEPTRRDDFDLIFMAARPAQGQELKPLLRFHDAGYIPVYAMGRIYSGRPESASDQDLNDIVFPTTYWQLRTVQHVSPLPASVRGGAFGNFYALGQDAWRLLPWLPLMQKDPDLWFSGEVGAMRLQTDGRLYREPAWAQFTAGEPVLYQWPNKH